MYQYRVAFEVNGKELNALFISPEEFTGEENSKARFKERAIIAVQEYLREARSVPSTGLPKNLAIWPVKLQSTDIVEPLDAFEIED